MKKPPTNKPTALMVICKLFVFSTEDFPSNHDKKHLYVVHQYKAKGYPIQLDI